MAINWPNWGGPTITAALLALAIGGTGLVVSRNGTLTTVSGGASDLTLTDAGAVNVAQLTGADGGGAVSVPDGSFFTFGSSNTDVAAGIFRFSPATVIARSEKNALGASYNILSTDTSDAITLGGTANGGLVLNTGTGDSIQAQVNSTSYLSVSSSETDITSPTLRLLSATASSALSLSSTGALAFGSSLSAPAISFGASPATIGLIQAPSASTILAARNAANSANVTILSMDGSNNVFVGALSGGSQMSLRAASNINIGPVGVDQAYQFAATTLTFGTPGSAYTVKQSTQTSDVAVNALTIQAQSAFASASSNKNGGNLLLSGGTAAAGGTNGLVDLHNAPTTTSAPSAGGGGALPATPTGYMTIMVGGVSRQVAYY